MSAAAVESELVGREVDIDGATWTVRRVAAWSEQYVIVGRDDPDVEMCRPVSLVRAALAWDRRATTCPGCGSHTTPTRTVRSKIEFFACPDCDFSSWEPRDWSS